jgi:hypothetical protein
MTGEDDRRARPDVSVLPPVMENSQDKVAGEGFGADDGATGVVSLPVPGYTPPVSGSSPPVMSEGGVTPFFLFSFFLPLFFLSFFFFHPVVLIVGHKKVELSVSILEWKFF